MLENLKKIYIYQFIFKENSQVHVEKKISIVLMSALEGVIVHLFLLEPQKVIQNLLIQYFCYIMLVVLECVLIDSFTFAEEKYVLPILLASIRYLWASEQYLNLA
jgi:hypothetical protein